MRVGLIGRTLIGTAILALLVGALLIALILAVDGEQGAGRKARRSQQAIATANLVQRLVLDAESSVRGFLLAGDDGALATWRSARAALPRSTDRLVAQLADEPRQAARARAIRTDVASYLDEYATPVIARAQSAGVGAGRELSDSLQGGARSENLRGRLATLALAATAAADARQADADAAADRAKTLAICGLIGFVALLGVAALLITRRVARPVRDLARAADRVRDGDFDAEVPVRSSTEVGRLTESFNAMTRSLAHSRDELESQNAELEARQTRLTDAGEELRAQRDEVEATAEQLAGEKRLAELFGEFAERLAAESDVHALAPIVLETIADVTGAPAGVLYGPRREGSDEWTALAVRGVDKGAVPAHVAVGGEGDGARAVASQRPLSVATASGSELHVPLLHGVRAIGLVTLRRAGSEPGASGPAAASDRTAAGPVPSDRAASGPAAASDRAAAGPVPSDRAASGPAASPVRAASDPAAPEPFDAVDMGVLRRLTGMAAVAIAEVGSVATVRWLVEVNRVVLDSVRDGIALFGRHGRVILSNTAIERIAQETIGTSAGGTIARGPAAIAELTRDPAACIAAWERILSDPADPTFDEFEIAETGQVLELYTAPVDAPPGRRVGRLLVVRDVTDARQAERLKSDLMSTVSHELRTPLASVLGYTELLQTREMDSAARGRILDVVYREAQRLSALIDDFLDLQRIEQGRLRLERRPFRLDELLDEQVRTFSGQSSEHRLELALDEPPLVASGDRRRIAQVVANLLSNAIKYSPGGGLVRVEGTVRDGDVRVAVSDQGLGIPADDQPHLFEKFFRVARPEIHEIGGTGLGLALAHDIVAGHEGEIGFESVEGEGSRFWFTLPGA